MTADLIKRLEEATAPNKKLFVEAYEAVHGKSDIDIKFGRFLILLDAGAWTDAALTLVPEGWNWHGGFWATWPGTKAGEQPNARMCVTRGTLYTWEWIEKKGDGHNGRAATIPLALCIAALRARSSS